MLRRTSKYFASPSHTDVALFQKAQQPVQLLHLTLPPPQPPSHPHTDVALFFLSFFLFLI
jgi:hypothetical protein